MTWIGTEGSDITLPDAIQQVLDVTTRPGLWPLNTVGDLEWALPAFELGPVDDVLQLINDMARQRGAVVRWWYDATTERFQLTLFVLQEDKETPDFTYGVNDTGDIPQYGSDITNVRNHLTLEYVPTGQDTVVTIVRSATDSEVEAYGLKPIVIGTDSTTHIKDADAAGVMLDSVEGALRLPAVVASRMIPGEDDIEINSLISFAADARVSQEDTELYATSWTERWQANFQSVVETRLRNGPVGQLRAWLRKVAGLAPDDDSQLPAFKVQTISVGAVFTCFVKIMPRRLAVLGVTSRTREAGKAYGIFSAPTRSAGAGSLVFGGSLTPGDPDFVPLGIGEYETDVALTGDLYSSIHFQCQVTSIPDQVFICEVDGDANADPAILSVTVNGQDVTVVCDDDALMVDILKVSGAGSAYDDAFDFVSAKTTTFAVPLSEGDSPWTLELRAYNTLDGDPTDLISDPWTVTVENTGIPTIAITPNTPADGSGVLSIDVQASAATAGYYFKIYGQYQTYPVGGGAGITFGEMDMTPQLSPSPLAGVLPTVSTPYYLSTEFVRDDGDPQGSIIWQFRVTLVDYTIPASPVVVYNSGAYPFVVIYDYRVT
jgi:hypothetical protein